MSTNKTPNYDLHSWVPQDDFHMTEINENFTKLDTALKTEATAAAQGRSALQTALNGKADASAVTTLSQQLAGKADAATVNTLSQQVAGKASTAAVTALSQQVGKKAELVLGSYVGPGSSSTIHVSLGFQPRAVFAMRSDGVACYDNDNFTALALSVNDAGGIVIDATGFTVRTIKRSCMAYYEEKFNYCALR